MKEDIRTVIYVGGRGTRMGNITTEAQKCLLPIDEKPILSHVMENLVEALGSVNAVLCVSFLATEVENFARNNRPNKMKVEYVWDVGDSRDADMLRSVASIRQRPFIAVAGDVITEPGLYAQAYQAVEARNSLAVVSLSPNVDEVDTHPVAKIREGRVTSFLYPAPDVLDGDHLRDMTIRGFSDNFLSFSKRFPEMGVVSSVICEAVKEGEYIAGHLYEGRWVHVGYPEDLAKTMK